MSEIVIQFGRNQILTQVYNNENVMSLKEKLRLHHAVNILPENMTFISGGKVLHDEDTVLSYLKGTPTPKIILVGSSQNDIESVLPPISLPRVRDDLNIPAVSSRDKYEMPRSSYSSHPYRFNDIQTLPLPNRGKAHQILQDLANDPGVLAVLKKYKWNVGVLCELYPEGSVGVSDVCVMGLNENKGSRILLRIRTDDLQGFRKPLSIRKVLYHELAHNAHSEHNDDFYQLMRQIEKDALELDWTKSNGHKLDPSVDTFHPTNGYISSESKPTVYRLGSLPNTNDTTSSSSVLNYHHFPAQVLATTAAVFRLSEDEKEIQSGCGCNRPNTCKQPISATSTYSMPAVEMENDFARECSDNIADEKECKTVENHNTDNTQDVVMEEDSKVVEANTIDSKLSGPISPSDGSVFVDLNAIMVRIDDTLVHALAAFDSGDSSGEGGGGGGEVAWERLGAIREAVELLIKSALCGYNSVEEKGNMGVVKGSGGVSSSEMSGEWVERAAMEALKETILLLRVIVGNAKDLPDAKYRSVNRNGKKFKRLIQDVPGALQYLISCGFKIPIGVDGRPVEEVLSLNNRYDVCLLYIGASILDVMLEEINIFLVQS